MNTTMARPECELERLYGKSCPCTCLHTVHPVVNHAEGCPEFISDESLVADYTRLMSKLDNSKDYLDSLAAGLLLFSIRRIMDERGMEYPQCPVAETNP